MLARHAPIVADVNGETLTLYVLVFCVLPPQVANRSAFGAMRQLDLPLLRALH
jgi:hypothetical protein